MNYRNDPKFSDRLTCENSVDPDQTAPRGSTLFAIPSASFGCIIVWKIHISQILGVLCQYLSHDLPMVDIFSAVFAGRE